jgi:LacI family transcriptional regulator
MTELLQQRNANLPTAVLAMNDLMAIGAMEAIRDSGLRIPEDISVVGFDNREVSDFVSPALTTVDIDLERIGYTSAEMIVHKLNGKGDLADEKNIVLPGKLIIRDSVKKLI